MLWSGWKDLRKDATRIGQVVGGDIALIQSAESNDWRGKEPAGRGSLPFGPQSFASQLPSGFSYERGAMCGQWHRSGSPALQKQNHVPRDLYSATAEYSAEVLVEISPNSTTAIRDEQTRFGNSVRALTKVKPYARRTNGHHVSPAQARLSSGGLIRHRGAER